MNKINRVNPVKRPQAIQINSGNSLQKIIFGLAFTTFTFQNTTQRHAL